MHSARTSISTMLVKNFRKFLDDNNMAEMILGDYTDSLYQKYICYAYSDRYIDLTHELTALTLAHGSLENAFRISKYAKQIAFY